MTSSADCSRPWSRIWLGLALPLALLPLLLWHEQFRQLYWFGDEWDLLDQISRQGFWPWTRMVFAENFVPLFKVLWGGLALVGNGSYANMIYALWATHLLVVLTLGQALRRAGFSLLATVTAMALLGLAASNLETLAWSVQWAAVLSVWFFLIGTWVLARRARVDDPLSWGERAVVAGLAAASALCLSRGVLTGGALAVSLLWQPLATLRRRWFACVIDLACCLLPGIAVALVIAAQSSGNHRSPLTGDQFLSMSEFAAVYFGGNPFWRLLNLDLLGFGPSAWVAAGLKLAVVAGGLRVASTPERRLLCGLLAFDLGNAFLLGMGRYHTGLEAAGSLRYQYASLICTLPFLGVLLQRFADRVIGWRPGGGRWIGPSVLVTLAVCALWQWPHHVRWFGGWRGSEPRALLQGPADSLPAYALPGIPYLPTQRGLELIAEFKLH